MNYAFQQITTSYYEKHLSLSSIRTQNQCKNNVSQHVLSPHEPSFVTFQWLFLGVTPNPVNDFYLNPLRNRTTLLSFCGKR